MIGRLNAINGRSNCVNDQRHERKILLVSIWKNCFSTWNKIMIVKTKETTWQSSFWYRKTVSIESRNNIIYRQHDCYSGREISQLKTRKNLVFVKDGTIPSKPKCGSSLLSKVTQHVLIYCQK